MERAFKIRQIHINDSKSRQYHELKLGIPEAQRVSSELAPANNLYTGHTWLFQGNPMIGTCTLWAIANAALSIDAQLQTGWMKQLHNKTVYRRGIEGLRFQEAMTVINRASDSSIELNKLEQKRQLQTILPSGVAVSPEAVGRNAAIIQQEIEAKRKLCVGIISYHYNQERISRHAISIVGYSIGEKGEMNVQLIDPAWGIFPIPLELLMRLMDKNQTYAVSKKIA